MSPSQVLDFGYTLFSGADQNDKIANMQRKKSDLTSLAEIMSRFDPTKDKYISREFQKYGYYLAEELEDTKHVALYIKMAKEQPRAVLEKALSFVKDARARNKARLFMWKLKEMGVFGDKNQKAKIKNIK